jgi:hypothetical protein
MPAHVDVVQSILGRGIVIPACPLALTPQRKLDERRQRALVRYYAAAGVGGLAVGVHTTQFAIRNAGLLKPVLALATEELKSLRQPSEPLVRVGGICGGTRQAQSEASLLRELGYHAGLLNLAALKEVDEQTLIDHCRAISEVIPLFGFYLQPAVGGRILPYSFWRRFAEIQNVLAIKIAPFHRYQTLDVIRAVAESGRDDIALYTGNDDNILLDLLTPYRFQVDGKSVERRIVGGLLGHWAVWTRTAVQLHAECRRIAGSGGSAPADLLSTAIHVTDSNAAFFDAANGFAGCIPGIHEVLRRQGLLLGTWCLDSGENLSPGQADEIDRVYRTYPNLNDDQFVREHVDEWLR